MSGTKDDYIAYRLLKSKKNFDDATLLANSQRWQAEKQHAHIDWIRAKLDNSEKSGFTTDNKEQILNESKSLLNG